MAASTKPRLGSRRTHVVYKKGVGFIRRPVEILGILNSNNYRVRFLDSGEIATVNGKRFARLATEKSALRLEAESAGFMGNNAVANYVAYLINAKTYTLRNRVRRASQSLMDSGPKSS